MRRAATLAATLVLFLGGTPSAWASRYALLISASRGQPDEVPLRFATSDAEQLREVLTTLGDFDEENVVHLRDATADGVRRALSRMNARIREEDAPKGAGVLLVFYTGHADAESLHLSGTEMSWGELRDATAGSSAAARLLIVDACRSGQATRVKGTRLSEPFPLPRAPSLPESEGFAILSSAAAGELAQESDLLQGSFFTHHLLVALRGLADASGDGQVSLAEAYRYSSERTVASTVSTVVGVQHPTYAFELKGRADLILTRPGRRGPLGTVKLRAPGSYFFRLRDPEAAVFAEASVPEPPRVLRLPPGEYFVQKRTRTRLDEGRFVLAQTQTLELETLEWRKVELDQWVRKGGGTRPTRSLSFWMGSGSSPLPGYGRKLGGAIEGALDLRHATLSFQLEMGESLDRGPVVTARARELGASAGARRVFDVGRASFAPGIRVGASRVDQRFQTHRLAPKRWQLVPHLDTFLRTELRLWRAWYVGADAALRAQSLRLRGTASSPSRSEKTLGAVVTLGSGLRW